MKLIRKLGTKINKNGYKVRYGVFKCPDCLQEVERQLSNGIRQKSCGCVMFGNKNAVKHGRSTSKLYWVWSGIKQRTLNPKNTGYKNYGGRGITICPEWANDYIVFKDWALSNGYADNLEINRINNNGNYEPSNCDFKTKTENLRNKTNTITMEIANEIRGLWKTGNYTQQQLAEKYNVSRSTIS